MKLYLVENFRGQIIGPLTYEQFKVGEKVVGDFSTDGFYTAEEVFWQFEEFVKAKELERVKDKNKVRSIPAMKFEELQKYYLEWKGVK